MLALVVLGLCAATVPLAGGGLHRMVDFRLDGTALVALALLGQVLVLVVLRDGDPVLLGIGHALTFALGGLFVWRNRRVPGLLLLGAGGALNLVAIVANDGVMPARPGALRAAGLPVGEEGFRNSAAVLDPHLGWLGDTFAIPAALPLANVFSVGDVVLVVGVLVLLHVTCGSRVVPAARRPVAAPA